MTKLKLNDEVIKNISTFVRVGMCFRNAYTLSGIYKYLGFVWRDIGREQIKKGFTSNNSLYVKLYEEMDKAKIRGLQDSKAQRFAILHEHVKKIY